MDEGKNISGIGQKVLDELVNKGWPKTSFPGRSAGRSRGRSARRPGRWSISFLNLSSRMERLKRKSAALAMFREKYKGCLSDPHTDTDTLSEEAHRKALESSLISGSRIPQNPVAGGGIRFNAYPELGR